MALAEQDRRPPPERPSAHFLPLSVVENDESSGCDEVVVFVCGGGGGDESDMIFLS